MDWFAGTPKEICGLVLLFAAAIVVVVIRLFPNCFTVSEQFKKDIKLMELTNEKMELLIQYNTDAGEYPYLADRLRAMGDLLSLQMLELMNSHADMSSALVAGKAARDKWIEQGKRLLAVIDAWCDGPGKAFVMSKGKSN